MAFHQPNSISLIIAAAQLSFMHVCIVAAASECIEVGSRKHGQKVLTGSLEYNSMHDTYGKFLEREDLVCRSMR